MLNKLTRKTRIVLWSVVTLCFVVIAATAVRFGWRYSRYCHLEEAFSRQYTYLDYNKETNEWSNYGVLLKTWEDAQRFPTYRDRITVYPASIKRFSDNGKNFVVGFDIKNRTESTLTYSPFLLQYLDGDWYIVMTFEGHFFTPTIESGERKIVGVNLSVSESERFYGMFRAAVVAYDYEEGDPAYRWYALSKPFWILPKDYQ